LLEQVAHVVDRAQRICEVGGLWEQIAKLTAADAGTPFCFTIDGQTKQDGTVTVRSSPPTGCTRLKERRRPCQRRRHPAFRRRFAGELKNARRAGLLTTLSHVRESGLRSTQVVFPTGRVAAHPLP
jgi:hypothetical protein